MASKEAQPAQKQPGMFSQLKQLFAFTYKEDKALPWLCGGVFIAPVILCVVLGLVFHWGWFAWITSIILALMIGLLLFTIVLTRRADASSRRSSCAWCWALCSIGVGSRGSHPSSSRS